MSKKSSAYIGLCLLLVWALPASGADIFSAVPGEAYGFVATKNLQGSYENIMAFIEGIGAPAPSENFLEAISEHVGDVDLTGPAAVVLLNPEEYGDEGVVLLFSAADAAAVVREQGETNAESNDEDLPEGVVRGDDGYMAVKDGFVIYAPEAELAAQAASSETSIEVLPEVREAFEKGQIVLAGEMSKAGPWLIQMLDVLKSEMTEAMSMGGGMSLSSGGQWLPLYIDMIKGLVAQCEKVGMGLDANGERAILTKRVQFKADSAAGKFMNAQAAVPMPSLGGLPAGSFLLAGAMNVEPTNLQNIGEAMMELMMELETIKEAVSEAGIAEMRAEAKAANGLISGYGFTLGIGSLTTGMLNMVVRYDVSDAKKLMEYSKNMYEGESAKVISKSSGVPINYVYTAGAEEYGGVQIDTLKMEITEAEEGSELTDEQQMQMMAAQQSFGMIFGPEMLMRMAATDEKHVVLSMGGGVEGMERVINTAKGRGTLLAEAGNLKQAAESLPKNRFAEMHLDLTQVMPMMMMGMAMAMGGQMDEPMPSVGPEAGVLPISMSVSAEANTLRADLVVPTASIKAMVEMIEGMMGSMRGGPGSGPPPQFEGGEYEWEEDIEEDF